MAAVGAPLLGRRGTRGDSACDPCTSEEGVMTWGIFEPGTSRSMPDATAALRQLERLLAEAGELGERIASAMRGDSHPQPPDHGTGQPSLHARGTPRSVAKIVPSRPRTVLHSTCHERPCAECRRAARSREGGERRRKRKGGWFSASGDRNAGDRAPTLGSARGASRRWYPV